MINSISKEEIPYTCYKVRSYKPEEKFSNFHRILENLDKYSKKLDDYLELSSKLEESYIKKKEI